jgi:hypothetical protein
MLLDKPDAAFEIAGQLRWRLGHHMGKVLDDIMHMRCMTRKILANPTAATPYIDDLRAGVVDDGQSNDANRCRRSQLSPLAKLRMAEPKRRALSGWLARKVKIGVSVTTASQTGVGSGAQY